MSLENKILSKEIQQLLYDNGKTLGTAESCTGGRIAESIIAVPGASNYFKGDSAFRQNLSQSRSIPFSERW